MAANTVGSKMIVDAGAQHPTLGHARDMGTGVEARMEQTRNRLNRKAP